MKDRITKGFYLIFLTVILAASTFAAPTAQAAAAEKNGADGAATPPGGTCWYLAEGYTGGDFDAYVLVQNAGDRDANVTMDFRLATGAKASGLQATVTPETRLSVHLDEMPGLSSAEVSTIVTSDTPVVVERAMYFDYYGRRGGHVSVGARDASISWYFAEGYTAGGFDTYMLILNPSAEKVRAMAYFVLPDGRILEPLAFDLEAYARRTLYLDAVPGLESTEVSTLVVAGSPIVAERSMYFDFNGRDGGSCSLGTARPCDRWYFAEGCTGEGFDTYLLLQNPNDGAVNVEVGFQVAQGRAEPISLSVPGNARRTLHLNEIPGLGNQDVSTTVSAAKPVVAERAMYFECGGGKGGHCSIGYKSPSKSFRLTENCTLRGFESYLLVQNPNRAPAKVKLEFQADRPAAVEPVILEVPARTRTSLRLNGVPGLENTGAAVSVASDRDVVVESSEYYSYYGKDGGSCSIGPDQGVDVPPRTVTVGAVTIEYDGRYYRVTKDMTRGASHYQIGRQYGQAIKSIFKDYEFNVSNYLAQLACMGELMFGITPEEIIRRINVIKKSLPADYSREIEGLASTMEGTLLWDSTEEMFGINLLTDVGRGSRCSALGAWGQSSSTGSTIAFRTLDWFGGLGNEINKGNALTVYRYRDRDLYLIGTLGHIGCLTGISMRAGSKSSGVMGAILDCGVDGTEYRAEGCRSYVFDLRYALEHCSTKARISDFMTDPARDYAYSHLIFLADKDDACVVENNVSGVGDPARRASRTDASELNPWIHWEYPSMLGVVNAFCIKGQVNNFSEGGGKLINTRRWRLMRDEIGKRYAKAGKHELSPGDVRAVMTSYWGDEPEPMSGDLYNPDSQQMALFVPASGSLEVFFKPMDGSTPLEPEFVNIPL